MPAIDQTAIGLSSFSTVTILIVHILISFLYVRNWSRVQKASASAVPAWR